MMRDPLKNGKLREVFFRHRTICEAWCFLGKNADGMAAMRVSLQFLPTNHPEVGFQWISFLSDLSPMDLFHYGFDWTRGFPRGFPLALVEPSAGLAQTELLEAFETLALPEDSEATLRCLRLSGCKQMHTRQLHLGCQRQVVKCCCNAWIDRLDLTNSSELTLQREIENGILMDNSWIPSG